MGTKYVGGLVGRHANLTNNQDVSTKSTISNCLSSGSFTGTTNKGGLVGYNRTSDILSSAYNKSSSGLDAVGKIEKNNDCKIEIINS